MSGPIRQSGRLDLENGFHQSFKGLLPLRLGLAGLELLYEIFLDSDSI
jgi:hypothetical protein